MCPVGFRLKPDETVSNEIRRIVLKQFDLAATELKMVGDPESDEAVHDARRRVKKIRAIVRLVRPVLDKTSRALDPDLRRVSKLLAPVADGQGVIETLNELGRRYRQVLPQKTVEALRADLLAREQRIDARAKNEHVLQEAKRTLREHRAEVRRWQFSSDGFGAIAEGLKDSVRRARNAMVVAWLHPTAAHHHAWRRYVKNHWFHVRLLEERCGNHLMPLQRRLETLDGVLGEYHNLVLLREVLAGDSNLSERDVAQCLRVVTRYQRALRQHAQVLGLRVYSEKPRRFVRRVRTLWRAEAAATVPVRKAS